MHGFLHPEDASLTPPIAVTTSEVPTHNGGGVVGTNAHSGMVEVRSLHHRPYSLHLMNLPWARRRSNTHPAT